MSKKLYMYDIVANYHDGKEIKYATYSYEDPLSIQCKFRDALIEAIDNPQTVQEFVAIGTDSMTRVISMRNVRSYEITCGGSRVEKED